MKYKNLLLPCVILLIFSGCSTRKRELRNQSKLVQEGKLWSALWQQRAAEYKALCFQAYNVAQLRLNESLKSKGSRPLAVITDIDETVLDNSPNAVSQALKDKDFEQQAWYEWTGKASCDTVPGAPAFFKYAESKGVEVFYITNRDQKEQEATLQNLKRYNLPFADEKHLLLRQSASAKEPRRQQVLKTYDVVLLIGDNLSDFSSAFDKLYEDERMKVTQQQASSFGGRFIVVPNATYGDWEGSLFRYNYQLSRGEKERIIKNLLRKE
ncbi:5'-nucleotidase, lipoprotein e(P4) family [Arcticibacter sp. MXS-1]|uniref:5'-nucleotidase, lipoprotein e(P4) family n=1 Tax=Arcticibacter sp. MXS-1 TaxID=3341726 RepID=UPI0035A84FC5